MKYTIQEMKSSGYTYYEIIDTENNCTVVFRSINYLLVAEMLRRYRNNEMWGLTMLGIIFIAAFTAAVIVLAGITELVKQYFKNK